MKKHRSNIILICIFLVGLSVMLYPSISNYVNSKNASKAITSYHNTLDNTSQEEFDRIFAEADDYNDRLATTKSSFFKPSLVKGYEEALDITGTGIMGYIKIDKIDVELPIYHSVDEGVLQIGVGHLEGSALPTGGKGNHCVLSGHRGLPSAKLFTDLDELEPGDTFTITVLNRLLTYEVDQVKIVSPTDTDDLQRDALEDYCTLVTCTPYGINTHRMLVRGRRIENADAVPMIYVATEAFRIDKLIVASIIAIPMLLILLIILIVQDIRAKIRRRKARQQKADANPKEGV
ncbi:MAG: class C sortase [Oscillospiraceae bacterium]|nr:class C sortase [Oscillospiraceae bacterium]